MYSKTMFSILSRGYGSWDGKAKQELIDSPESQESFYLEESPLSLPPLTSLTSPPHEVLYRSPLKIPYASKQSGQTTRTNLPKEENEEDDIQISPLKLPAILSSDGSSPGNSPRKTFTTRSGALILYSENLVLPSSKRKSRRRRRKRKASPEIKTIDDLRFNILNYKKNGGDPLFLNLTLQNRFHQTSAKRDVRPGFSPKRYIANLGRNLNESQWEKLIESGSLQDPALKTFKPSTSTFHSDGSKCDLFPDRLIPYSTMSLPAVSPAHSVKGSLAFYENGMSEGAASLFDDVEEFEEEEDDDDVYSSRPDSPGEELIDRLPEVQSPWKLTYASLHPEQKKEILSQLLLESTLQRSSTIEEWVTSVSEERSFEADPKQNAKKRKSQHKDEDQTKAEEESGWQIPRYDPACLSPGIAKFPSLTSFIKTKDQSALSGKSSSLSSLPVLPPINDNAVKKETASKTSKGTAEETEVEWGTGKGSIKKDPSEAGVALDEITVSLSKEDTKTSSEQWPANKTEYSETSIIQSKSSLKDGGTVQGWDAQTSGSEGGWPAMGSERQPEVKTKSERTQEIAASEGRTASLVAPESEYGAATRSVKTSVVEEDGWPGGQIVEEESASHHTSVRESTKELSVDLENDKMSTLSAATGEKPSEYKTASVSEGQSVASKSAVDTTDPGDSTSWTQHVEQLASVQEEPNVQSDRDMTEEEEGEEEEVWGAGGQVEGKVDDEGFVEEEAGHEKTEQHAVEDAAIPQEDQSKEDNSGQDETKSEASVESHITLAELENQAQTVAKKVLSRPQSGVFLKEDVEMAAKIWAEALEEILGPVKPGARVSSAHQAERQAINQLLENAQPDAQAASARRRKISRSAGPAFYEQREALRQAAYRRPSQKVNVGGVASGHTYYQPKPPDQQKEKGEGSATGSGSPGPTQSIPADRVSNAEMQMDVISYMAPPEVPEVTIEPATPGDIGTRPLETPEEESGSEEDEDFAAALNEIVQKLNKPTEPVPSQRRRSSKRQASSKTDVSSASGKEEEKEEENKTLKVEKEKDKDKDKTKEKRKRTKSEKQKSPFHAGKVKEEKPPAGLKEKKKRKGKEDKPKDQPVEEKAEEGKAEKVEEVSVDEETGELVGAKSTASESSDETYSETTSKTPSSEITSATLTSERPQSHKPTLAPTDNLTDTKVHSESEYSEQSQETAQTDSTQKLDPNSRALKRAQAAERRRQEVERKRREREEAKRLAQEEAERAEQVRREAEEEMQRREEERMRIRQEREEEQRRKEEAEKEKERQAKAKAEREKRIREEWKRKQAEIMAQRKLEEELRLARERAALEVEQEEDKEEEERLKNMEEEERLALLEQRRIEMEELRKQEELRKERELEERRIEEEHRLKVQEELRLLEQRRKQRQAFILGLIREFGNLLLGQRTTRAFTFSYFNQLPWMMDRLKDIKNDRPKVMETIQEEDEEE